MPTNWPGRGVQHVTDGEPVTGSVDGRPTRQLEARSRRIESRIDEIELGRVLVDADAPLEAGLLPGMAAAYDPVNDRYFRGLAALSGLNGSLETADSSYVQGVVQSKFNATTGDVVLYGRARIDLTQSAGPDSPAGRYYLSPTTPGRLVRQAPPLSVLVGEYDGEGSMFVRPQARDFLDSHRHFAFDLACVPAGDSSPPDVGDPHTITSPDPTAMGWLPAGHASFNGTAPVGASFGYNIAADPALLRSFPPLPVSSAMLFWDRGVEIGGTLVQMGPLGHAVVDSNGIWWMTDTYGNVPWPVEYEAIAGSSVSSDPPYDSRMSLKIVYASLSLHAAGLAVTSLRPAAGSPLTFVGPDGKPATTGDLTAAVDLSFTTEDEPVLGNSVLKSLDGTVFSEGPVVGRIKVGPGLSIEAADPGVLAGGWYAGDVIISTQDSLADREVVPSIESVATAKVRTIAGVSCLGLPPGSAASRVRIQIPVPSQGLPPTPKLRLRIWLGGTSSGTLPVLGLTGVSLPRPSSSPVAIPASPTTLAWSSVAPPLVAANTYVELQSVGLPIVAGGMVVFELTRAAADGYAGEALVLRVAGVITGP